jgi:hypothetical protein
LWILWVRRTRADLVLLWLFLFYFFIFFIFCEEGIKEIQGESGKWKGVGDGICFVGVVVVWCSEH